MFEVIDDRDERVAAQERFNQLIKQEWRRRERRNVVWRPDSRLLDIAHNGRLWFVSVPPEGKQNIRRYWNSFGTYNPTGGLFITVEVNVPIESTGQTVSGYFARDPVTGIVYLMHDGAVGGGRKGVGRGSFLLWSSTRLVPAIDSHGRARSGIVVGPLIKGALSLSVSRFVNRVAAFKRAVRDGQIPTDEAAKKDEATYKDYFREFSGRKRGRQAKEIEYISRHGDIVDELTRWKTVSKDQRIVKNAYIDLGIEVAGALKVLYEVKTNASRQNLYAAIGQILVHGINRHNLERYIVVPADEPIPSDVRKALTALDIGLLRYTFSGQRIRIKH